jgi:protease I
MSKIAVIIADMFEDVEYTEPAKAFGAAGHELVHVGLKAGETVKGKTGGTEVKIDKAVQDASVEQFDALLIPGGFSPDKLRSHEEAVDFTRRFSESGKPMFIICHGPQLLINAGVLKGKKATGWKSIRQDMLNAGAEVLDLEVVEDGNMIFSRGPQDIPAFVNASLNKLKEVPQAVGR